MSGGSFGYLYLQVREAAEYMPDAEIAELITDLADVLHDLEWVQSGDSSEDVLRCQLDVFKNKWFKQSREKRLERIIDEKVNDLRTELLQMID